MPHIPELDGLRAIAILIVFFGHLKLFPAFPGGFGVTIFFFLSGFLITTLLRIEHAATGRIALGGFYLRRFLRINPPLWIAMAFAGILIALGLIQQPLTPLAVAGQALFFVNYLPSFGQADGLPIPLWSLAVEEHFYLLFPISLAFALKRFAPARVARACAILCVVVLLDRLVNVVLLGIVEQNYYWTHTRIDSILFGCVLALAANPIVDADTRRPPLWLVAGALLLILLTFAIRTPAFREGLRYTLQGVALYVLFAWTLHDRGLLSRLLRTWPMQRIGLYSYTLYLVHYPIIVALRGTFPTFPSLGHAVFAAILSLAVADAMYRLVERPLARLRKRLNKVESPAAGV